MRSKSLVILWLCFFSAFSGMACQCPVTKLGLEECNKYDIIFKGKIVSVIDCKNKPGEAVFEIEELYKGTVAKQFKVLFNCNEECAMKFSPGDEWIIYSRYKQVESAMMDWCSRSRKYFKNEKEDFYTVNYGNDYYDEAKFLQEKLGLHRVLAGNITTIDSRNVLPTTNQTILIFLCSVGCIILFYWLFNKFFR